MNEKVINNICKALQAEAEAIKSYTYCMNNANDADTERTFAINRLDAMDHIQSLTIQLTKYLSGPSEDGSTGGESYE